MLPYGYELALNSANNYGNFETRPLFSASTSVENIVNRKAHLDWIFTQTPFEKRSFQVPTKMFKQKIHQKRNVPKIKTRRLKKKQRRSGKIKNCLIKLFKKKRKRIRRNGSRIHKKYLIPFILGLLVAKSLLIPVALKVLAFISAKGLMMGFFSTALASLLSLKGIFEHSHGYKERKGDTKTQVEIIQIPSKNEDHIYYDEHYTKGDYFPNFY